ncbi:MAG: cytosine permease [Thermaerobacter sp.]|nr:cytosine permease [Thermaerobacter sp.]
MANPTPEYGDAILKVETYGIERIAMQERHGTSRSQFTLWLGANLTIADFALGFLPISMGLSWWWSIGALLVGNLLGAIAIGLCAAMGPSYGLPQLMISRFSFGRRGGYAPSFLNYLTTLGWFTVNNILGAFGIQILFHGLSFWEAAAIMVILEAVLAVYGHNLIHSFEKLMAAVLSAVFIVVTIIALTHSHTLASYAPHVKNPLVIAGIILGASFSYLASWGAYASDYSRYLAPKTSKISIGSWAFLGAFIATFWLEIVGMLVGILSAPHNSNPIAALNTVMGGFGAVAIIAIILGGIAANVLNIYSNALCAGALDLRLPRWRLAIVAGLLGFIFSVIGSGNFDANYENYLYLIGYWVTPWLGILVADFYIKHHGRLAATDVRDRKSVNAAGLITWMIGVLVMFPFMNSPFFEGFIAKALSGVDISYYVGFVVAGGLYLVVARNLNQSGHASPVTAEVSS